MLFAPWTHARTRFARRPPPARRSSRWAASAGVLTVAALWAWAIAAPTSVFATCSTGSASFGSTGAEQCYNVAAGVSEVAITAIGGKGGIGYPPGFGGSAGAGAIVTGDLPVIPGEVLYVEVGANGTEAGSADFGGGGAGSYEAGAAAAPPTSGRARRPPGRAPVERAPWPRGCWWPAAAVAAALPATTRAER